MLLVSNNLVVTSADKLTKQQRLAVAILKTEGGPEADTLNSSMKPYHGKVYFRTVGDHQYSLIEASQSGQ